MELAFAIEKCSRCELINSLFIIQLIWHSYMLPFILMDTELFSIQYVCLCVTLSLVHLQCYQDTQLAVNQTECYTCTYETTNESKWCEKNERADSCKVILLFYAAFHFESVSISSDQHNGYLSS